MYVLAVLSLINSCQPQRQSPLPYIVDSTVVLSTMTLAWNVEAYTECVKKPETLKAV